jgi:cardiolipin synthase
VKPRDIPNMLCVLRMAMALPIGWLIVEEQYGWAVATFVFAGATDGLDGLLAKRLGWQSELGGLLDPIADKLLLVTAFVSLWVVGGVPAWLLATVVARDAIIIAGAIAYRRLIGPFVAEPTLVSKLNSVAQLLFVTLALAHLATGRLDSQFLYGLEWAVLATTIMSGVDYVVTWTRRARAART